MNILLIGGGGREHALISKIRKSPRVREIFCAPGNPGMAPLAKIVPIPIDQIESLLLFAKANHIDLTLVGPELPLSLGIVDRFEAEGLRIFGPHRAAAQIEVSKVFSKELMQKYGVPTPRAEVVTLDEAYQRVKALKMPIVLKAEGLASGKGVIIAHQIDEAVEGLDILRALGNAADRVILEEYLTGIEASVFILTDGQKSIYLTSARDYKRAWDGDCGPNTGGMGAISPSPEMTPALEEAVMSRIIRPVLAGLVLEGTPYRGVLYAGLMLTDAGPYVLEFNARWGDPEAQAVLPRLKSDWIDLVEAALDHRLDQVHPEWEEKVAVCVVLASEGYPGDYSRGINISGLDQTASDVMVFHAGTARSDEAWLTQGGRVLGVTALAANSDEARRIVYQTIEKISFKGMQYRKDIGGATSKSQ